MSESLDDYRCAFETARSNYIWASAYLYQARAHGHGYMIADRTRRVLACLDKLWEHQEEYKRELKKRRLVFQ